VIRTSGVLGLACMALLLLAGCTPEAEAGTKSPRAHKDGLPERIAEHIRNPDPALRLSEERTIGDGNAFGLPGVCDDSEATLAVAERGHGTERHEVGWYSVGQRSYSVVRWDWTDESTYDTFVTAMLEDDACLSGPWDQELRIQGAPARLRQLDNRSTSRALDTTEAQVVLAGSILDVNCSTDSLDACKDFVAALLDALDVSVAG
jgi:hypothetical protein